MAVIALGVAGTIAASVVSGGLAGLGTYFLKKRTADDNDGEWKRGEYLGSGGFGDVYVWKNKKGEKRAVKEIRKGDITKEDALRNEAKILIGMEHPHTIRIFGYRETDTRLYMNMELMSVSVRGRMNKTQSPCTNDQVRRYTRHICEGLVFLHNNRIIHFDLKGENVLLDSSLETAKIADMGCAQYMHADATTRISAIAGTIPWMAPEVAGQQGGGRRSDIWSLGCTVYEMTKGQAPFENEAQNFLAMSGHLINIDHNKLVQSDGKIDVACKDLLLKIFVVKDKRPYAETVLQHHYIKSQK